MNTNKGFQSCELREQRNMTQKVAEALGIDATHMATMNLK